MLVFATCGTLFLSFFLKIFFNFCNAYHKNTVITTKPPADDVSAEVFESEMGEKVPMDMW